MRTKVVVTASVVALAILVPALYFHFKPEGPAPAPEQPAVAADNAPPSAPVPSILKRVSQGGAQQAQGLDRPSEAAPGVDHDTYVLQRKAELMDLAMSGNPANLKTILSELENPEPEIRQTALTATLDFNSKEAIPTLQNELNWASDPEEKVAIKKAIDFLQLPSFGSGGDVTQQAADGSAPAGN